MTSQKLDCLAQYPKKPLKLNIRETIENMAFQTCVAKFCLKDIIAFVFRILEQKTLVENAP